MKRSPIEQDHVKETELIATFGEARLVKRLNGRLELVGGSQEDRQQAREWMDMFLGDPMKLFE